MTAEASSGQVMFDYYALVEAADNAYKPLYLQEKMNSLMAAAYAEVGSASGVTPVVAPGVLKARNDAANLYDKTILDKATVVDNADVTRSGTLADGKKNIWDAKVSAESTALTNYNTAKGISDPLLVTRDAAVAAHTLATNQHALQVKVEAIAKAASERADADKLAKTGALSTATQTKTQKDTDKTAADTAYTAADTDYTSKAALVTGASGTKATAATHLTSLASLRTVATNAWTALDAANVDLAAKKADVVTKKGQLAVALAEQVTAVLKCKEAKYDSYKRSLATAITLRQTQLSAIETLIDDTIAAKPAAGAAGARCEKPTSAGNRKERGKICNGDSLCCGAATGNIGGATMTIEVCQDKTATKYSYQPPRGPLEVKFPTKLEWPFACIGGAKHLAAAATAVAGAFYMMA